MESKKINKQDLVKNASFCRMVKGTASADEVVIWNDWIEENDQNRRIAIKAIADITGFEFREPDYPDIENEWVKLYSKTIGLKDASSREKRRREKRLGWIVKTAALMILASIVGIGLHYFADHTETLVHLEQLIEEKTIVTGNGEQKTLTFSNGTKIVLNRNTTMTYSLGVLQNQTIDVTLEGEAWFDVVNDPTSEIPAFAVYTPDGIIRDIGTKFLVTVEQGMSRVVLQEGIVEIEPTLQNVRDEKKNQKIFQLEKGELVEFNRSEILERKMVNTTIYSAWATQFIQFERTSIEEFAEYIEQRFDVEVEISGPNLSGITLDGAVYFRSLEELVRSVSDVIDIPVYQSKKRDVVYFGFPK